MSVRKTLLSLALVCAILGLGAEASKASLWLQFSALEGTPGDTVTARTLYEGAFTAIPEDSPPVRVFLVRADHVISTSPVAFTTTEDERLIEVGVLTVDAEGNGELTFTVPQVPPGAYTTITQCAPCAPFSAGRELLATGPSEPFLVLEEDGGGLPLAVLALVTTGLLAVTALALVRLVRVARHRVGG
jgi:hypothetical protein